jgi:hypothetical protein
MASADPARLAAFVAGLPDGHRHAGFFWAVMTAEANHLDPADVAMIADAGVTNGLDEDYVHRTVTEARKKTR